jgi:hypothetical protein
MSTSVMTSAPRKRWVLILGLALLTAWSCQPKDERPGFGLRGPRASEPVRDWRFTDEIEEIAVQTRTWYGLPHSTTIWCAQIDGDLYVGSYGWEEDKEKDKKFWERNAARNPAARLRIDGVLYDVTVTPVDDPQLALALDLAYTSKYDMADVFGENLPDWWYYRVELRDP